MNEKIVKKSFNAYHDNLEKKNNLFLVAQDKGQYEVKGFLYLQTITIPSTNLILKGVVEDIYTKPQYRKQGIATKLLSIALDWSLKQDVKQIDFISLERARDLTEFCLKFLKSHDRNIDLNLVKI